MIGIDGPMRSLFGQWGWQLAAGAPKVSHRTKFHEIGYFRTGWDQFRWHLSRIHRLFTTRRAAADLALMWVSCCWQVSGVTFRLERGRFVDRFSNRAAGHIEVHRIEQR